MRALLVLLIGLAGCGGGSSSSMPCTVGTLKTCTCGNGLGGRQMCKADGTYSPCICTFPSIDAGADARLPAPDATPRGPVPDFQACNVDADCMNATSDCRLVPVVDAKRCVPRCTATAQCAFDTVCWPSTDAQLGAHCWRSSCGQSTGNGVTGGACQLGAETGLPPAQQLPGYCAAISDDVLGQCVEVGTVAPGGTCSTIGMRGGANCDASGACIAPTGMVSGVCRRHCDPRQIAGGGATGCMAGEGCVDLSTHVGPTIATSGVCVPGVTACTLFGAAACPAMQACLASNAVRATGTCDVDGAQTIGAACTVGSADPATRCASGLWCDLGAMTCAAACDVGAMPAVDCGALTCQPTTFAAGVTTLGWGTCR